jgi:hypothetical protein
MLDLLLDGSKILRKADELPNLDRKKRGPFLVDMLQDCITLDDKMKEFILEHELLQGGPLYWPVPSKRPDAAEVIDAPVSNDEFNSISFEFPTVRIGTTMMLYWASLLILWSATSHIYEALEHLATLSPIADGKLEGHFNNDEYGQTFQIPLPTRFRAFPPLARNICQSVGFCLRDETALLNVIAPLNMIIAPLKSWPGLDKEIAWVQNLLVNVQNRGMKIIEHLPKEFKD